MRLRREEHAALVQTRPVGRRLGQRTILFAVRVVECHQRPVHPLHLTKEDIEKALASTNGNIDQATRLLGVVRNTLTSKMDRFGIPRPQRAR